jgi:NAD(P)-dependent dehydrogenase (short-subunit alcohol dehydrogenase family)
LNGASKATRRCILTSLRAQKGHVESTLATREAKKEVISVDKVLKDKVAIITGSGRGIGKAIALAMAKEGARVVTNDCDPEIAEAVAKEIADSGGQAISFVGDVSKFEEARKLIQAAVDNFGRLDILVNNAGIVAVGPIWDMTEETWDKLIAIHLKGHFNCIRHACVIMKEQGWGRIINTTSIARLGTPEHANYCAAKAGIVGLTKGVALDLGSYGITCNAYGPHAATRGNLSEETNIRFDRALKAGIITKESVDRLTLLVPVEKTPPFIIYLCTDEAADINGQVFETFGQNIEIYTEEAKNRITKEEGLWTTEELKELVPKVLLKGVSRKL